MFIFPGGGGPNPSSMLDMQEKMKAKVYTGIFCIFYYFSPNIKIDTLVVRHPATLTLLHCT